MIGAVLFDMDGLLIDSEPLWVRAEIEVFGAAGLALTEHDCARTKGLRVDDVVAFWNSQLEGGFREARAEIERRLVARVVELVAGEGRALPGVETAIAAARASARHVALASSSPIAIIDAALRRLGLERAFDAVQSAQTEPYGKPHPGIFMRTAERLAVSPLACVVIEDSLTGVIAAKAARMDCIAVPFDHPNHDARFALADVVYGSLEEITPATFARSAPFVNATTSRS
jgi:sugar-phosphatase